MLAFGTAVHSPSIQRAGARRLPWTLAPRSLRRATIVALGALGDPVAPYNTLGMYRGWISTAGELTVATHAELHHMGRA